MCALERDDVDGAADLYRRALAARSTFDGLARSLLHLQHDPTALRLRIEKLIEADFAADSSEAAKSDSPAP
ncbi:MAG: hypothetical protein EPO40_00640 [Myxococcaceae bacterium]|nr:MAG: hypothetical protein EPO40_00640 [Myxococcaceae bacterium]